MSLMFSMPTARRTSPGVTPVGPLLLAGELRVGRRGRMDHEAAHVADVRDVAVQLERLDERSARLGPALDLEGEHGTGAQRGVLAAQLVPRAARQSGVGDLLDLVAALEPLGHRLGVGDVPLDAQAQRLDALGDQEGVERGDGVPRSRSSCTRALRMNARLAPSACPRRGRGRRPGRGSWGRAC